MYTRLLILAGSLLVSLAGCSERPAQQEPRGLTTPEVTVTETGTPEVQVEKKEPLEKIEGTLEEQIARRSERWKAKRRVEDFLWLVAHAIPTGTSRVRVQELLGKPLCHPRMARWVYIEADSAKGQPDSLSLLFHNPPYQSDGESVIEFCAWPKQREKLRPLTDMPSTPWETPREVREAFLAAIGAPLKKRGLSPEYVAHLRSETLVAVQRQSCSYALHLYERSGAKGAVYGTADNLRRDGECWSVRVEPLPSQLLAGGPHALLDARTGELLLLFFWSEG